MPNWNKYCCFSFSFTTRKSTNERSSPQLVRCDSDFYNCTYHRKIYTQRRTYRTFTGYFWIIKLVPTQQQSGVPEAKVSGPNFIWLAGSRSMWPWETKMNRRCQVLIYICFPSATASSKQYYLDDVGDHVLVMGVSQHGGSVQPHVGLTCFSCRDQVLRGTQLSLTTLFCVPFEGIVAVKEDSVGNKMGFTFLLKGFKTGLRQVSWFRHDPTGLELTYNKK